MWSSQRPLPIGDASVTSKMPEGAIEVKHGDWLSKYSAALYNDLTRIDEFGRIDKSGSLQNILNVNHIFAGENDLPHPDVCERPSTGWQMKLKSKAAHSQTSRKKDHCRHSKRGL